MASWLTTIFGWLGYVPKAAPTATASSDIGIGITTDIGAVANAAGEGFKLADEIAAVENTPAMQKARQNVEIQKAKDQVNKDIADSLKSGDVTKINRDLS